MGCLWTAFKWTLIGVAVIMFFPLIFVIVVGWAIIAGSILDGF